MVKKVLIGVGIFVLLLAAGAAYLNHRNRTLSPPGHAELKANGMSVSVEYSRPSVRDRMVFGPKEHEALQPYGKYWRFGANESTELTTETDIEFAGNALGAGTYKIYAVPGPDEFTVVVSNDIGTWGAMEPDHDLDLFEVNIPVIHQDEVCEQHTIWFEASEQGIDMLMCFEHVKLKIPMAP